MKFRFSIILPVYNVEKYLSACIDSILNQTFKDYEIILVDDGSKDSSGAICDNYASKHNYVKVIHKPNGGQSDARNVGLRAASGEYVFFMDSDDLFYTDKVLEKVASKTKNNPDVVFHKHIKWFENTGTYSKCDYDYDENIDGQSFEEVLCKLIDNDAYGNAAWKKFVRRELLVNNGIEFQTGISAEDNDWFYKVLMVMHSVELIDEVFYVYRQREGSVTHGKSEKLFDNMMWIIEKWAEIIKQPDKKNGVKVISNDLAYQYCNAIINFSQTSKTKESFERLKKYKYLLQYGNNPRVKSFRSVTRLIDLKGLVLVLSTYGKLRK